MSVHVRVRPALMPRASVPRGQVQVGIVLAMCAILHIWLDSLRFTRFRHRDGILKNQSYNKATYPEILQLHGVNSGITPPPCTYQRNPSRNVFQNPASVASVVV